MLIRAYAIESNSALLKKRGIKNRVLKKAKHNSLLTHWEKYFNELVSKRRYTIEQAVGTLKRRFDMSRARYLGAEKVQGQLYMKATCFNLLKAVNLM